MAQDPEPKLPTVREHADAIITKLMEENPPTVDPAEIAKAASIPTFSKGTATLGADGKPLVAKGKKEQLQTPEFSDGQVSAVPTEGVKSPEELLAEHRERLAASGKDDASQGATAQAEEQASGEAAAEAAAEAMAEEYAEFEWEDPDLSTEEAPIKFPIKVPKKFLETAKRGYGRRAAQDRLIRYLKDAEPILRPMIEDGRIKQILPLIQAALENTQYGEYVTNGFQRLQQGVPLIEQANYEAAQAAAAAYQAPAYDLSQEDPFFAERVAPILQQQQTLQQRLDTIEAERQQLADRQRQETVRNQQFDQEMRLAHRDLASAYPGQCNPSLGPNDPFFKQAVQLAGEAGYTSAYGLRAGVVFGGQQAYQIEQERLAATASPAAAMFQGAEEAKLSAAARQEAQNASRMVGGGSVTAAPQAPRPQEPTRFLPDGRLKPIAQFVAEQQQYLAQIGSIA